MNQSVDNFVSQLKRRYVILVLLSLFAYAACNNLIIHLYKIYYLLSNLFAILTDKLQALTGQP